MYINEQINIIEDLNKLLYWIDSEGYKGYDPYDTLNAPIFSYVKSIYIKYIALQINKYLPINIRPLIGLKKDYSPKGIALFLNAYSKLMRIPELSSIYGLLNRGIEKQLFWIKNNKINLNDTICWAMNFPLSNIQEERSKNDPSSVLNCFMGEALYEYYINTKDPEILNLLIGISNFLNNKIPVTKTNYGLCYSYTQHRKDIVFNANMHVAEFYSKLYKLTDNEEYKYIAKKCVNFTIKNQKSDGRWEYSISENGQERHQYDFHQGFILCSLYDYMILCNDHRDEVIGALQKGYIFYKSLFYRGKSYWRYPKKYPIDIHNQAMGIICFSKLSNIFNDSLKQAEEIFIWTINNMQDKKGFFYTHSYPLIKNKIPYIRWGQAWMCLAFAECLQKMEDYNGKF
ncbi:MAG TPA: hypothetical protein PLE33_01910 [Candidatus Cloacimonas sp.]|nr:hypothetical protein [Candidatus Cloacimonas sp.]